MDTRICILSASVGVLLLTTAPGPIGVGSGENSSSQEPATPPSNAVALQSADAASSFASAEHLRAAYGSSDPSREETIPSPVEVEEPTLWLARAIYSETKLPHEQELVAWVVRNRVETGYRGNRTYRAVVLDPYQFSAFNPGSSKRSLLMGLGPETALPGWQQALWVAYYVRHAAPAYRPFSVETRHFYSERSMKGRPVPYWADGSRFVPPEGRRYTVEERRFRFYKQIS